MPPAGKEGDVTIRKKKKTEGSLRMVQIVTNTEERDEDKITCLKIS